MVQIYFNFLNKITIITGTNFLAFFMFFEKNFLMDPDADPNPQSCNKD